MGTLFQKSKNAFPSFVQFVEFINAKCSSLQMYKKINVIRDRKKQF